MASSDDGGSPGALDPLLRCLRAGEAVRSRVDLPCGVLLPDGRLDLSHQQIGPAGVRAVVNALRGNTCVTSLLLAGNRVGPEGAVALAELLRRDRTVRAVHLGANGIGPEGVRVLAEALAGNTTVRGLWLRRNALGVAGARHLADLLGRSCTLRALDVADNDLGAEGAGILAGALAAPSASVEALYLGGNGLGGDGAASLAAVLGCTTTLAALDAGANGLGDEGARLLAAGLRSNRSLTLLDLAGNGVGPEGVGALAEALEAGATLRELELGSPAGADPGHRPNRLGDAGAARLAVLLRRPTALASLGVARTGVTEAGARVLLEALEANRSLVTLAFGERLPAALQHALMALLCRNAARTRRPGATPAERARRADLDAVRSVNHVPAVAGRLGSGGARRVPDEERGFDDQELAACVKVLRALTARARLVGTAHPEHAEVRALAARVARGERREDRHRVRADHRARREAARDATSLRRDPAAAVAAPGREAMESPGVSLGVLLGDPAELAAPRGASLARARPCYVCKRSYTALHFFYDRLCPACAAFNWVRRGQRADLGAPVARVALVTGARIKVGYEVVLKLLRAGARVIATTRFPRDAARRLAAEPDFGAWRDRAEVYGLDLRSPAVVERFAAHLESVLPRLDVVVHNAAQTVYRPPAYYAHLQDFEAAPEETLPAEVRAVLRGWPGAPLAPLAPTGPLAPDALAVPSATAALALFPPGSDDGFGQPLDLRSTNSWRLRIDEVPTAELLEVHAVNALAPFILNARLRALMTRGRTAERGDRYIVHVSAVEGQFYRAHKSPFTPHTNMAKAALNMLTRTAAQDFAADRIFVNSVDTGWLSNDNPHPIAQRMAEAGFRPPLDAVDAAARVLDPVFRGVATGENVWGLFLKDYEPAPW